MVVYDDALDAGLCAEMVQNFEKLHRFQQRNGEGVRPGLEKSAWVEINVSALADFTLKSHFEKVVREYFRRYNEAIGLSLPISALHKLSDLMMKRYRAGANESFQLHFDSIRAVSNRYLVFLWYLNSVPSGGETVFPDIDVRVEAKVGRLVVFPPYWMFQHAGLPPQIGEKYIASTYALY